MKRILIALLSFTIYISAINLSTACEFLKEEIGTPIVNILEKYDFLNEPNDEDGESLTFMTEYDSFSFCEDSELDNSSIKVFVRQGKIIGTEIIGGYGEASTNKIFNFANNTLGYISEEVIEDDWVGGISLASFGIDVIYGRVSDSKGNFETLTITKPEFKEYLFGPEVIEVM